MQQKFSIILWITVGIFSAGSLPVQQVSLLPNQIELKKQLNHYATKLESMTPQPHWVNPQISLLCRAALPSEIAEAKMGHGPHNNSAIKIYTNTLGKKAFDQHAKVYPVGTLIIKEKHTLLNAAHPNSKKIKQNYNIGGMIKQVKGYNPQNGDWAYFYQTAQGKLSYGKMASCQKCHAKAQANDYVFKRWLKPLPK